MASSPLFWLLAFVLVAGTLTLLLLPLLRRSAVREAPADQSAATAVFRDHKRQIDADFTAGSITTAERDTALEDLTARFGHELAQNTPPPSASSDHPRLIAAFVLVACVPIVAGVLYFLLGNPAAITAPSAAEASLSDPQVTAMVDQLAKRLQANPDDGEGWMLLGRSYRVLGRHDTAALAYAEAAKRLPASAALYVDWAEAVAQAQGRTLVGQPTELINRALALDPANPKALALGGAAAMERNDPATAMALWTRLKAQLPPDSPQVAQVDAAIARLGEAPAANTAAPSAAADAVQGRVELDPKLAANAAPGDTVFIFARDPDGPRMPLAAMKVAVSELPKAFTLTDAMAMSPANTISKAKKIVVEARVSKSGNAAPQAGDLAGSSVVVAPGASNVRVTIDRVVP